MKVFETSKENNLNSRMPFFNNGGKQEFFDFQSEMETEENHWFTLARSDNFSGSARENPEISFPNPRTESISERPVLTREDILTEPETEGYLQETVHFPERNPDRAAGERNRESESSQPVNANESERNSGVLARTERPESDLTETSPDRGEMDSSLESVRENPRETSIADLRNPTNTVQEVESNNAASNTNSYGNENSFVGKEVQSVENKSTGSESFKPANNTNVENRVSENNADVNEGNHEISTLNFNEGIAQGLPESGHAEPESESVTGSESAVPERASVATGTEPVHESGFSDETAGRNENQHESFEESGENQIESGSCKNEIDNIAEFDLKAFAGEQMNLIIVDGITSQEAIDISANEKEAETNSNFNQLTGLVTAEFEERILKVPMQIGARSIGFLGIVLQRITGIQQLAQQMITGGWSLFSGFLGMLTSSIATITANAIGFISNAAASVLSLIQSIPLPDIPGVNRLREIVVSIISGVVGNIQQFISQILLFGNQALVNGMSRLTAVISRTIERIISVSSFFTSILNLVIAQIMNVVRMFVLQVVTFLRSRFFAIVLPFINRLRRIAIRLIRSLKAAAKAEIILNTNYHLLELSILAAQSDSENSDSEGAIQQDKKKKATQMQALSVSSQRTNKSIVAGYRTNLVNQIASTIQSVFNTVRAMAMAVWGSGVALFNNIVILLAPFVAQAEQLFVSAGAFLFGFLSRLTEIFMEVFQSVYSFLSTLTGAVLRGITTTVARVRDRIFERIRNFVFGD